MNNDLIERYIYAVTKRMNRKQRDDVAQELRSLVDDMLTERCDGQTPTEKDIRVVLTELGTPQELYAKYDEDAEKCLIGQPYYSTYKFVMKILLLAAAGGVTIASIILNIIEPQGIFHAVTAWFEGVWDILLSGFAIITLAFAYCSHKGIRIGEPFNFDDLPPVPKKSQEVSKWDCIAGIGFCVFFVVLFLFMPNVVGAAVDRNGFHIPMLNVDAVQRTWYIIIAFAVCGILRESVQLMECRYNKKVLTTALATDAVSAVLGIWWLTGFDLINPEFLANAAAIFEGENSIVITIFSNFQGFFLGVILFALLLDAVDATVRTLRK